MNDFCIDLNISIPFIEDEVYLNSLRSKYKRHNKIDPSTINTKIIDFFKNKNLQITLAESFYRMPEDIAVPNIHKDAPGLTDATKINWVYGGGDSVMNWYQPKVDNIQTNTSAIGITYEYYKRDDVELIHSQRVGFPSIVQVGLPHDISNITSDRLCISVFVKEISTTSFITFEKAKKIFQNEMASCTGIEPVSAT